MSNFSRSLKLHDVPHEIVDWTGLDLLKRIRTLALRTAQFHVAIGRERNDLKIYGKQL